MVPYQLPLDLRWAARLPRNSYTCIFKFCHNASIVNTNVFTVRRTNTYVTEVGSTLTLYSHPSVVGLISGTSAVSLVPRPEEKTRLLSSSLSLVPRPKEKTKLLSSSLSLVPRPRERDYISLQKMIGCFNH